MALRIPSCEKRGVVTAISFQKFSSILPASPLLFEAMILALIAPIETPATISIFICSVAKICIISLLKV